MTHPQNETTDTKRIASVSSSKDVAPSPKKARTTSATSTAPDGPQYGDQSYWEDRYQRLLTANDATTTKTTTKQEDPTNDNNDDDAPLPFHAWYFTYEELRPLLVPLLFGNREETQQILQTTNGSDADDNEPEDKVEENEGHEKAPVEEDAKGDDEGDMESGDNENDQDGGSDDENDNDEEIDDDGHEDDDEFVEVLDDDDENDDDDDEEVDRGEGLVAAQPISIVEIGCGDVPLGLGLARDLAQLPQSTSTIIQRVACLDYSPAVISQMKQQHAAEFPSLSASLPSDKTVADDSENTSDPSNDQSTLKNVTTSFPLEFGVADARKMDFPDQSVKLILEKGTLDAMLSDPQDGMKNCQATVRECARVLAYGGCLVLISHWNAHTEKGKQWLQDIVFVGLQEEEEKEECVTIPTTTVKDAPRWDNWEIEVHGNEESSMPDSSSKEPDEAGPGPAVYIIHKKRPAEKSCNSKEQEAQSNGNEDSTEPPTIPIRFFSY